MNPNSHQPHGIVIGGGIGGMALAAALGRVGISCEVHEQAEELREVGAGLTLWSNALVALDRLGAAERVMALGSREDRFEVRTPSGQLLAVTPLAKAMKHSGMPACVCVHRADLLRELISLSPASQIHLGSRCLSIQQDGNRVTARFATGETRTGDFLVGADGLRSAVRAELFGESEPRYAGYTCWRGIATTAPPIPLAPQCAFEVWGNGRRFSLHHCGPGRLFWYATHNQTARGHDGPRGRRADVQELFSSWHEPIPSVIAATSEILRNDILDRPPAATWGRGRITLLGDAAHPTTPNLGQGACQALEDAIVLADLLRRESRIQSALRTYERLRHSRTSRLTVEAFRLGRMLQVQNPVAQWLRNTGARCFPSNASWWFLERRLRIHLPELCPASQDGPFPTNRTVRADAPAHRRATGHSRPA